MNVGSKTFQQDIRNGEVIWQQFAVSYDFPIHFLRDAFAPNTSVLSKVVSRRESDKLHRCLVFLDDGLAASRPDLAARVEAHFAAHATTMTLVAPVQTVPGGETCKQDDSSLGQIRQVIADTGLDRHGYVIAIGGGAVLDAVGFAAATAHRGIRHIRFPSTVLSQNDSGVGVKNAVNAYGQKNYCGTFAPPWAVINDLDLLDALPVSARRAGISEAIKVALIRDGAFFNWIEANADLLARCDPEAEEYMIRRCAQLHIDQIGRGGDPFESGSSRPLDFGHWSAHRLEAMTDHALSHGDAVAIGIALDCRYSVLAGLLPEGEDLRVLSVLRAIGLPTWHPILQATNAEGGLSVLGGLEHFRAHLGGDLTITLLTRAGEGHDVHEIDSARMAEAIGWLQQQAHAPA